MKPTNDKGSSKASGKSSARIPGPLRGGVTTPSGVVPGEVLSPSGRGCIASGVVPGGVSGSPLLDLVALIMAEAGVDWISSRELSARLHDVDPRLWPSVDDSPLAAQRNLAVEMRSSGVKPAPDWSRRAASNRGRSGYFLSDVAPDLWAKMPERAGMSASRANEVRRAVEAFAKAASTGTTDLPDALLARLDVVLSALGHQAPDRQAVADPCGVYAYEDANGVLLYVGITCNDDVRHNEHVRSQPWSEFAHRRIELGTFAQRQDAAQEEARLIHNRTPVFNRTRLGWIQGAVDYLLARGRADRIAIKGLDGRTGTEIAIRELASIGAYDLLRIV